MSINYGTPHKSSYLPVFVELVGNYELIVNPNGPNYYGYNFTQKNIPVLDLTQDAVYLFERMSIGGSVSEETFLNAIVTPLSFNMRYTNTKRDVLTQPISILKYSDDRSVNTFLSSPAGNDVVMNVTGVLEQTQELIGVEQISVFLTLEMFETNSTEYNAGFNNALSSNIKSTIRGGR